eukprot:384724_1
MSYIAVQTDEKVQDTPTLDDYAITSSVFHILSPNTKSIEMIEWNLDPLDDKLIDGYIQQYIYINHQLYEDIYISDRIKCTIAKYYTKKYSKAHLVAHYYQQKLTAFSAEKFGIFEDTKKKKKKRTNKREYRMDKRHTTDYKSAFGCLVYMLWIINIIGTPVFAVIAVYGGIEIHNYNRFDYNTHNKNEYCDVFSGWNSIGTLMIIFGILTLFIYSLLVVCICSHIGFLSYNVRLILSSVVYTISLMIWMIFYGYVFHANRLLSTTHSECFLYVPDFVEVFELLIIAFAMHTITMPFFCIVCVVNTVKAAREG